MNEYQVQILLEAQNRASKALTQVDEQLDDVEESAQSVGDALRGMSATAAIAGGAIVAGLGFAVNEASDLGESINAVNVTFGEAAGEIHGYSEQWNMLGLSVAQANQAVVPMGALLQNVGFTAHEAANESLGLARRAADLASVFNVDLSTALDAIQSGLKGEADPLEQFGVGLSATALDAYAMSRGIQDGTKSMTDQEKALLRLDLFFEQTDKFANDFTNTQGSLANATRIAQATLTDTAATIGQALLPIIEDLISKLAPLLQNFAQWTMENEGVLAVAVPLIASLGLLLGALGAIGLVIGPITAGWAAMTTVISALTIANGKALAARLLHTAAVIAGTTATVIATAATTAFGIAMTVATGPIGLVILAIAGVVAGIVILIKNWDLVSAKVVEVWEFIVAFIGEHWKKILAILFPPVGLPLLIAENWGQITEIIGGIFEGAADRVKGAVNAIIGFINRVIGAWNSLSFDFGGQRVELPFGQSFDVPKISIDTPNIPTVPHLAEGGIVRRPTLAMIGERGPEAVVPLNSGQPMGITVNVNGDVYAQDGYAFADKVTEALRRRNLVAVT